VDPAPDRPAVHHVHAGAAEHAVQQVGWHPLRGAGQLGGRGSDARANPHTHPPQVVPQLQSAVAEAAGEGRVRFAGGVHLLGIRH